MGFALSLAQTKLEIYQIREKFLKKADSRCLAFKYAVCYPSHKRGRIEINGGHDVWSDGRNDIKSIIL